MPIAGINFAGAEFGIESGDAAIGFGYRYPVTADLLYFIDQGINMIRLPFSWERLQRPLNGALDSAELAAINATVDTVTGNDGYLILDPHNYAAYRLTSGGARTYIVPGSSGAVNASHLADFWTRLANEFKSNSRVIFNLMNEPFTQSAVDWRDIALDSIAAIRATGAQNQIQIPGTRWTGAHSWLSSGQYNNGSAWTAYSPGVNDIFEAHQYFDSDSSGQQCDVSSPTIGADRLVDFTGWCRTRGFKAHLGEFGCCTDAASLAVLENALQYMDDNSDVWESWTYWAAGAQWRSTYKYLVHPTGTTPKPQELVLLDHVPAGSFNLVAASGSQVHTGNPVGLTIEGGATLFCDTGVQTHTGNPATLSTSAIMTFPTYGTPIDTDFTSPATSHLVNMPASVAAGEALLVSICALSHSTLLEFTTPVGWTQLFTDVTDSTVNLTWNVYAKVAAGTEGGTTVDFVTNVSDCEIAAQAFTVDSWGGTLADIEVSSGVTNANTTPNPPSLSPTWGLGDTLWIALLGAVADAETVTGYPTNYSDGAYNAAGGGPTAGATVGLAFRQNATATEDPATFTLSGSERWWARTIAVKEGIGAAQVLVAAAGAQTHTGVDAALTVLQLMAEPGSHVHAGKSAALFLQEDLVLAANTGTQVRTGNALSFHHTMTAEPGTQVHSGVSADLFFQSTAGAHPVGWLTRLGHYGGLRTRYVVFPVGETTVVTQDTQLHNRYADGLYAVAMCDRCGVKKPYLELRLEEWTRWRVCKSCIDPYPLQIKPKLLKDTYRVKDPRPDKDID